MKATISKTLPVIMLFMSLSVSAQINSGIGYMHGTDKKKNDTSTVSKYDADKAEAKKDHADTVVIKRKPTAASEARQDRIEREKKGNEQGDDTAAAATGDNSTADNGSGSSSSSAETYVATANADCVSPGWRYAAVGLGLLSLLLILLLIMGRKKDQQRRV